MSGMASGRVNSKESLATASRMLRSFGGSWAAVEKAATRDSKTGVYVVRRSSGSEAQGTAKKGSDRG
jgi:hypothetical protein